MIGKKVILRALEPSDVDILYKWENDMSIWHLSTTIAPLSQFSLEQYVLNTNNDFFSSKQIRLMVDLTEPFEAIRAIGSVDLFEFEPLHQRAGVGILILKDFRGKGYASEALDLLIDYAFNTLQLHQLFANISPDNQDSMNLFQNKHFQVIGIKKEWNRIRNNWQDETMLQLINH